MVEEKLNQPLHDDVIKLSFSKLANFDRNGPSSLLKKNVIENEGISFGSLVDMLSFEPENFKNTYYIFNGSKPTATLGLLADIILKECLDIPTIDKVLQIIKNNNFWSNVKSNDVLIEKFNNSYFWEYLKCNFEKEEKIIVDEKTYNLALEIVQILKNSKISKHFFKNSKNIENFYQLNFEYNYKNVVIRGIIDIVTIDHKKKEIYFTDLKTGSGSCSEFQSSFIKWKYYFQSALYIKAYGFIIKKLNLKNYTLKNFKFLYISKIEKIPVIYTVSDKWYNASFKGFYIDNIKYRGIDDLINQIKDCYKNNNFNNVNYYLDLNNIEKQKYNVELKDEFLKF